MKLQMRYQKSSPFKEYVFVVNKNDHVYSFEAIQSIENKLKAKFADVYLPVFTKKDFASLRVKGTTDYPLRKLYRDSVYEVSFVIKQRIINDKLVITAFTDKVTLIKRAKVDEGQEIDISLSDVDE